MFWVDFSVSEEVTFVPRLTTLSTFSLVTFSSTLGLSWRIPLITV